MKAIKLKSRLKTVATVLLCALLACGAFACDKGAGGSGEKKADVHIWSTYTTEKILRDRNYVEHNNANYNNGALYIDAVRNEHEGTQLILSLETTDAECERLAGMPYTVTVSDLTCGANKLDASEIEIYHEKYQYLRNSSQGYAAVGYFPDALLPYQTAVEYGENTMTGRNQGVWLSVKPKKTQPAGTYTGTVTVSVGGKTYNVPLTVRVRDYTLSDEVHAKTSYALFTNDLGNSEHDSTVEMYDKYYEYFLDHRMCLERLPAGCSDYFGVAEPNIERFLEYALKYAVDPRCSTYNLPYNSENVSGVHEDGTLCSDAGCTHVITEGEGRYFRNTYGDVDALSRIGTQCDGWLKAKNVSFTTFNRGVFDALLPAMVEKGLQEGVDLLTKASTYFLFFDEFDGAVRWDGRGASSYAGLACANYNIKTVVQYFKDMANTVKTRFADCEATTGLTEAAYQAKFGVSYGEQLEKFARSLIEVRHKAVGTLDHGFDNENTRATMVVIYDEYPDKLEMYAEYDQRVYAADGMEPELWSYTCIGPKHPYPNYMIDTHALSPRIYAWTRYNNNIVGDLLWKVAESKQYDDQEIVEGQYTQIFDYYDSPTRFPSTSGDGFLVYPGRVYGIDGPVGSIRVEQTSDGLEEYDMLYDLERKYRAAGVSTAQFDAIVDRMLRNNVFDRVKIRTRDSMYADFDAARTFLLDMLEAADCTGAAIEEIGMTDDGNGRLTVGVPASVTVTADTGTVSDVSAANGRKTVCVTKPLTDAKNVVRVTFTDGDKKSTVTVDLGGKSMTYDGAQLADKFVPGSSDPAGGATVAAQGNTTDVLLDGVSRVRFDMLGFTIDERNAKLTVTVTNRSDTALRFDIAGMALNSPGMGDPVIQTVAAGESATFEFEISKFMCETYGDLSRLIVDVKDTAGNAATASHFAIVKITVEG